MKSDNDQRSILWAVRWQCKSAFGSFLL